MAWTDIPDKSTGDLMDETWYDTHFKANMEHLKTRFDNEEFPTRATMWHDEATVTNGNALVSTISNSQLGNFYSLQSTAGDSDSFTHSFYIKAGTYTIYWLGRTNSGSGKIDWSLDGVDFETGQDWYSGTDTYNVIKSASITIAEDGKHVLRGTVNGRSGLSSSYAIHLTKYWIKAASD